MSEQVFEKHSNLPHRQPVKTAYEPACRAARYRARVSDTADSILTHASVARVRATLAEAGVQGAVVVIAVGFVLINFAVDLLYAVLDPRIRHARAVA